MAIALRRVVFATLGLRLTAAVRSGLPGANEGFQLPAAQDATAAHNAAGRLHDEEATPRPDEETTPHVHKEFFGRAGPTAGFQTMAGLLLDGEVAAQHDEEIKPHAYKESFVTSLCYNRGDTAYLKIHRDRRDGGHLDGGWPDQGYVIFGVDLKDSTDLEQRLKCKLYKEMENDWGAIFSKHHSKFQIQTCAERFFDHTAYYSAQDYEYGKLLCCRSVECDE